MRSQARTRLAVVAVVLVVGIGLGVAIGGVPELGDSGSVEVLTEQTPTTSSTSTSTTVAASASASTTSTTAVRAEETKVVLYNASSVPGAAARASDGLRGAGYQIVTPGPDVSDRLAVTAVEFASGREVHARSVASALGLDPAVVAAVSDPAGPRVRGADVVVLIGDDVAKRSTA